MKMNPLNLLQKLALAGVIGITATSISTAPAKAVSLTDSEFRSLCSGGNAFTDPLCTTGDKTFQFVGASFGPRPPIPDPLDPTQFFEDDIITTPLTLDSYEWVFEFDPEALPTNPGDFTYEYNVYITPDSPSYFAAVNLDTTVNGFTPPNGGLELMTSTYTPFNGAGNQVVLSSLNGDSDEDLIIGADETTRSLNVLNSFVFDSTNTGLPTGIDSWENSFVQRNPGGIPEPASMLGILVVGGLGFATRRKQGQK